MADHVHMMISIPPKYSVAQVVGYIKGKSAIHVARVYGERNAKGQFSEIELSGDTVRVGVPNAAGRVPTSSFKSGLAFEVEENGDVLLDELKVQTSWATVDTLGTLVDLTNSKFSVAKNPGGAPQFLEVNAAAGSSCDVTGTSVKDMTFTVNCDTVIGP